MSAISDILDKIPLPRMVRVRQQFDHSSVDDIPAELFGQLENGFPHGIRPGMRIAITCGSRGIANLPVIMRTIVDFCKKQGAHPFLIPAMGSHGGATAEGQRAVLTSLGVTEETCGCPIYSSMETRVIGSTPEGHPVQIEANAAQADGIIVVNRIKPHPVFVAPYESGLMKMMAIGLGKQKQAEYIHQMGFDQFYRLIPLFGNAVMEHANILFGVAILENAYDQTSRIVVLTKDGIRKEEPGLLLEAKANMPRLLPGSSDVLVVDRMGKDISGDGMDPNITGRFCQYYTGTPNFTAKRVVVLDLTDKTHGNFIGIEAADVTTQRVLNKADPEETYPNSLTSCGNQHMPMHMKSDKQAIQCAIKISTGIDLNHARIIRIPDTLHVMDIQISETMLPEIRDRSDIQILGEPEEWDFDAEGNLW
ncbi:lactate racemase domain-containing protein [Megamonas hypermegale]|uniref:lactate racemase domain-containing protein n=1 Tax=Megamonas hypermegale TaxID=158847 RepID=UPI0026EBB1B8|nr:lactate racemase domain-containing protein [Megamonas hypermegale]